MDRQFMKEFFDKMYEEPFSAAVVDDAEFESIRDEFLQMEAKMEKMLGGADSDECKFFVKVLSKCEEMWDHVMTGAYLMGARDREQMLR